MEFEMDSNDYVAGMEVEMKDVKKTGFGNAQGGSEDVSRLDSQECGEPSTRRIWIQSIQLESPPTPSTGCHKSAMNVEQCYMPTS